MALVDGRRDDQVHLAVLVLEQHEDDPVGGRGALAGDRRGRRPRLTLHGGLGLKIIRYLI